MMPNYSKLNGRPSRRLSDEQRRTIIYRFRLSPEEDKIFRQRAEAAGLERSDLIRKALGLEVALPPSKAKPDPKKEPGAAGISELADRMEKKRSKKNGDG